jgi:hypothetical protein
MGRLNYSFTERITMFTDFNDIFDNYQEDDLWLDPVDENEIYFGTLINTFPGTEAVVHQLDAASHLGYIQYQNTEKEVFFSIATLKELVPVDNFSGEDEWKEELEDTLKVWGGRIDGDEVYLVLRAYDVIYTPLERIKEKLDAGMYSAERLEFWCWQAYSVATVDGWVSIRNGRFKHSRQEMMQELVDIIEGRVTLDDMRHGERN